MMRTCIKNTSHKVTYKKCWDLLKKYIFSTALALLSSLISTTSSSCISINNQACKVRP